MTTQTCPYCGAEYGYCTDETELTRFKCGALINKNNQILFDGDGCYERKLAIKDNELAAQAAEIERLKALELKVGDVLEQAILNEREACAAECRNWWKSEDCEKAIIARDNQLKGQQNDK